MKKWIKCLNKVLIAMVVVLPMATSCYDDSGLWQSIDNLAFRLDTLAANLDNQMKAMNAILSDMTTIKTCKEMKDGSYQITLSDGTSFKVLPKETDFSALIMHRTVAGKKYWVTMGPDGELIDLTDKDGNPIPVEAEDVKVEAKLVDGKYYIVIDGKEFLTGYDVEDIVQVFSSCVPLKDASGNIYAMKFSFGEGMDVTVTLDGYKGVMFSIDNGFSATVISEYFVKAGTVQTFIMDTEGVIDYVMQIPDGWRITERKEESTGVLYVDIKAPSEELVASGAAVASGDLKVVSVVEGGKASVTRLELSSEPFKTFDVTSVRAAVTPYQGIAKFAYGLSTVAEYEEGTLLSKVTELITSNVDVPAGMGISESKIGLTMEEIYGKELSTEERYVFWALPVMYSEGEDAGFYVEEGSFVNHEFGAVVVKISEPVVSLLDAQIEVTALGLESYYAGTSLLTDDVYDNILYSINNATIEPIEAVNSYKGSAFAFPAVKAEDRFDVEPGTSYVTWIVPVDNNKTSYNADDIIRKEFTTKPIVSGGSLKSTVGEAEVTYTTISMPVESKGATMIYYTYMTSTAGGRLAADGVENDSRVQMILSDKNCVKVVGDKADATLKGAKANTKMWLFAVAVDEEGRYGEAVFQSAVTEAVVYNTLTVTVNSTEVGSDEAIFTVETTGGTAVEYVYWFGKTTESFWANTDYCGATRTGAQDFIASNPDHEQITRCMSTYGEISADGLLNVSDLMVETDYVIVVLAKDESGNYSKAGYKKITTLAADLGVVVRENSQQWLDAKAQVNLEWIQESFYQPGNSQMMGAYSFNFSCPAEYTAFVMCASEHYYESTGLTKTEHIMIEIQNYASRRYDDGKTPFDENGVPMNEPDYYKNGVLKKGQLMNVYHYYVHGNPTFGFVTLFGKGAHGEDNCIHWENGQDAAYQRALEHIQKHCEIEIYRSRAASFGLSGQEAEDWAAALLEAYLPHYKDQKPIIFENDGTTKVRMTNPYATGVNEDGVIPDRVFVMLRDAQGNYFEPMEFEVPDYFKTIEE